MTVIEVSLNRQRPGLVRRELESPREGREVIPTRKRKSTDGDFMQQIQGCAFGDFLGGDSSTVGREHQVESRFFRDEGGNVNALGSKKPKLAARIDLPQVRGRRKSRWKLKFHHQALPPEYLRHYKQQERKRRQTETKKSNLFKNRIRKIVKKSISDVEVKNNPEEAEVEEGERLSVPAEASAEEKSAETEEKKTDSSAQELLQSNISQLNIDITQNKAFLENLLTNQIEINRIESTRKAPPKEKPKSQPVSSTGKIMNFSDLPYMGEITLDGIKPRRGRKPKKADICHLIYKNYGQVFPGSPGRSPEGQPFKKQVKWKSEISNGWNQMNSSQSTKVSVSDRRVESPLPSVSGLINHTEVQNRIINSLLERRLTQEKKCKSVAVRDDPVSANAEEPLNLCIRDLQSLKIKLSRKHGNIYETKSEDGRKEAEDGIKKEVISLENSESEKGGSSEDEEEEDDLAPFNLVTTELRESSDEDNFLNFSDQITLTKVKSGDEKSSGEDPVMYWRSPLLYYDRLGADPPEKSSLIRNSKEQRKLKPERDRLQNKRIAAKGSPNATHVITKRKRSAIFIPPVPAENTTNPTTEVSICKFKFTGGAKPSLQEKKMLSVDSGGNFRYYSGTGDKSMRGYEYFPRESLQQCQENTGCSPSGVFLTASALGSGEKIPEEIGHSGFFGSDFPIQVPPLKPVDHKPRTKQKLLKRSEERYQTLREHLTGDKSSDMSEVPDDQDANTSDDSAEGFDIQAMMQQNYFDYKGSESDVARSKKSRKSKKSLAREKLEQTFKEKGFLIQTQQLESAEGATYCKFRQLRKFTRYLFRSWKDYLPGNVRDLSVDAGVEGSKIVELPEAAMKTEPSEPGQAKNA
ncbi:UNVERIFIED_CONTAM: hypothetical protein PYX00_010706 [Menopon gallinae]|uniref:Uncharacterized protein n=1 Tax=Menopon gallinae TaxID=328185 RepID=A0AAW2HGU6_9NEOP